MDIGDNDILRCVSLTESINVNIVSVHSDSDKKRLRGSSIFDAAIRHLGFFMCVTDQHCPVPYQCSLSNT